MDRQIAKLAAQYCSRYEGSLLGDLQTVYEKYVKQKQQTVLEAAAAAAAVQALFNADRIDTSRITPQMEEAFRLAFPNKELSDLTDLSPEQLQGVVSAWKGKYFEVLVRDRLNSGEWVGDLHLEPGQVAVLADSPTQAGWDIQILDADGSVAYELQAKATESLSYVKQALENCPDIQIVVTDEALQDIGEALQGVSGSGISDETITRHIIEPMTSLFDETWQNLCENILPFLPFVLILTTEGRMLMVGKKTAQQFWGSVIERSIKTGAAMSVGAVVVLLDGGLLSIPASILTRLGIDRYQILHQAQRRAQKRTEHIKALMARCPT